MTTVRPSRERLARLISGYPAAAVVLVVHFLIAVTAVREKSNTFDEVAHVTGGYSYWVTNDYRLNPENGILPQRWFALPLLPMGLNFPNDGEAWSGSDVWKIGQRFFFESGNDLKELLWRARCMNAALSVALGFLVYAWSRRMFGRGGGMISLVAYATDPTILANGSLATVDLAAAAFFTASVGCLWWMFHHLSLRSVVCSWLALAGLFLSKTSAALIIPIGVVLVVIRLTGRRPLMIGGSAEVVIRRRTAQAGVLCGVMMLQVVLVAAAIWACYGFRYSAFSPPLAGTERFSVPWGTVLGDTGIVGQAIEYVRDHRLLPEALLFGSAHAYHGAQQRAAFLNGQYSMTGWWYFFPYTFLVKTPLPFFLILLLAAAAAVVYWHSRPGRRRAFFRAAWRAFYVASPLWVLLTVYWAAAVYSNLNIGHRHILPAYPAMFILAGAAAHWFGRRDWLGRVASAVVLICTLGLVADCLAAYPHYLAYFNSIAGGSKNGYKHLVGSSLDWGQDLPGLKRWLKEHGLDGPTETPVYLAYVGSSSPTYYGIRAEIQTTGLGGTKFSPVAPLGKGVYCISATQLQQDPISFANLQRGLPGRWCGENEAAYRELVDFCSRWLAADPATRDRMTQPKGQAVWDKELGEFLSLRFGRLCAFLRQREPDDDIGYSILIYDLTAKDIQDALFGPPVWLDPTLGPVPDPG